MQETDIDRTELDSKQNSRLFRQWVDYPDQRSTRKDDLSGTQRPTRHAKHLTQPQQYLFSSRITGASLMEIT